MFQRRNLNNMILLWYAFYIVQGLIPSEKFWGVGERVPANEHHDWTSGSFQTGGDMPVAGRKISSAFSKDDFLFLKIWTTFFVEIEKIYPKIIVESQRTPNSQNSLEKVKLEVSRFLTLKLTAVPQWSKCGLEKDRYAGQGAE